MSISFNDQPKLVLFITLCSISLVESAYTYQKLNELMPELRQFLGLTHLGTLRPLNTPKANQQPIHLSAFAIPSFADQGQFQASKRTPDYNELRVRKSNNLRNLMRIGKRHFDSNEQKGNSAFAPNGEEQTGGNIYYYSPSFPIDNQLPFIKPYRPQSIWL
ncbi:unnamed protein product [Meloidogyne enterolobii]|uniref:Uncharacterized protein n=3 Tax=Meloidogyne enterolobii TaxID=390850 RepID=A0ACB1AK94_MELEN|nr:unnamed protein product [Meloidogyne enterolobii]